MNNISPRNAENRVPIKKATSTVKSVPLSRLSNETQAQEQRKSTYLGYMLSYFAMPSLLHQLPTKKELNATLQATGAEWVSIPGKGTTPLGSPIKLSGYLLENEKPTKKWIVYFLPNRALAETSLKLAKSMSDELDANVLIFNYRGVGNSTGHPSCAADLADDGAACFDYLHEMGVANSDICAYGHSIGGGAAAMLLSRPEYSSAGLIADRTFTTFGKAVEQVAKTRFSMTKTAASWAKYLFERSGWNFNSIANLEKIKGKVLITTTEIKYDKMVGPCQLANGTLKMKYTHHKLEPIRVSNYISDYHSFDIVGPNCRFAAPEKIVAIFKAHIHGAPPQNSIQSRNSGKNLLH